MSSLSRLATHAASAVLDKTIVFSFDRTGYKRHSRRFREEDLDVDLGGKVCLVTGANSGLGRATAFALARLGVWLAACERIGDVTGKFWFDREPAPTHFLSKTKERPEDRRALWRMCREPAGIEEC